MAKSATHIDAISRVMVPVTDQDRAIEFYVEKLGFEKIADVPFAGGSERWVEVAPPGSQAALALVPGRGDTQPGTNARVALSTDDVEAAHEALRSGGVDVDAELMRGDDIPTMFWFRDQDGNVLLLVQSEPR
jgi:catechol 2,3-dioxygenase-like lactoylglutathione lyase family enzyme